MEIKAGDAIEYRDGPHTFHVKAVSDANGERVQVESTITRGFQYGIEMSMIVSVQRAVPGEGTQVIYQA